MNYEDIFRIRHNCIDIYRANCIEITLVESEHLQYQKFISLQVPICIDTSTPNRSSSPVLHCFDPQRLVLCPKYFWTLTNRLKMFST